MSPVFGMSIPLFGMDTVVDAGADLSETGEFAVVGSLVCVGCGYSISLSAGDDLPTLPGMRGVPLPPRLHVRILDPRHRSDHSGSPDPGMARAGPLGARVGAATTSPTRRVTSVSSSSFRTAGLGSAGPAPPTSASTMRRSRAVTRSSCAPRRTSCARSTTAASTACSSTASKSSGPRSSDGDELEIGRYRLYVLEA